MASMAYMWLRREKNDSLYTCLNWIGLTLHSGDYLFLYYLSSILHKVEIQFLMRNISMELMTS